MRCVIAGSRGLGLKDDGFKKTQMTLEECPFVEEAFTKCEWYDRIEEIVSGVARGIDNLGEQLAEKRGLEISKFPADWSVGRKAGHLRNADMAKYTDIAIVLWDGRSKGTRNMIEQMRKVKKPCLVFLVTDGVIRGFKQTS